MSWEEIFTGRDFVADDSAVSAFCSSIHNRRRQFLCIVMNMSQLRPDGWCKQDQTVRAFRGVRDFDGKLLIQPASDGFKLGRPPGVIRPAAVALVLHKCPGLPAMGAKETACAFDYADKRMIVTLPDWVERQTPATATDDNRYGWDPER